MISLTSLSLSRPNIWLINENRGWTKSLKMKILYGRKRPSILWSDLRNFDKNSTFFSRLNSLKDLIEYFPSIWIDSSSLNLDKNNAPLINYEVIWKWTFDPSEFIITLSTDEKFDVDEWIISGKGKVGSTTKILTKIHTCSGTSENLWSNLFF